MLAVSGGLRIHLARPLAEAIQTDALASHYYRRPPLRELILLPEGAQAPARKYLDWHRQKVSALNSPQPNPSAADRADGGSVVEVNRGFGNAVVDRGSLQLGSIEELSFAPVHRDHLFPATPPGVRHTRDFGERFQR